MNIDLQNVPRYVQMKEYMGGPKKMMTLFSNPSETAPIPLPFGGGACPPQHIMCGWFDRKQTWNMGVFPFTVLEKYDDKDAELPEMTMIEVSEENKASTV